MGRHGAHVERAHRHRRALRGVQLGGGARRGGDRRRPGVAPGDPEDRGMSAEPAGAADPARTGSAGGTAGTGGTGAAGAAGAGPAPGRAGPKRRAVAPASRTRQPTEVRRRLILEAAVPLVNEHGARRVGLRDIARAAGVSVGTVTYHFGGVREIIGEAVA